MSNTSDSGHSGYNRSGRGSLSAYVITGTLLRQANRKGSEDAGTSALNFIA